MEYIPKPIDTKDIEINPQILELTEMLAKNAHDVWAKQRMDDGWQYGLKRDDKKKEHPCLVSYEELPESEKQYDRNAAIETIKVIVSLGYKIEKGKTKVKGW